MFNIASRMNIGAAGAGTQARVLPAPAFHDFAWSSKLIARDLKHMCKDKRTRISKKVKSVLGIKHANLKIPGTGQEVASALGKADSGDVQGAGTMSKELTTKTALHMKKVSQTTVDTGNKARVFSMRPDTGDTHITAPDMSPIPDMPVITIPPVLENNSFYHLLSDKLEHWYKTREFGLPLDQRWMNRGIFLFLTIAIELCPFNPSFDKWRAGKEAPDQTGFVRQVLQLGTVTGGERILLAVGLDPVSRISARPEDIYSCTGANEVRIDSAHSGISPTVWPAAANQEGRLAKTPPSPLEIWAALLVAVTFRDASANIAVGLLRAILPEEDANKLLLRIGDPAQRLRNGEDDELREKLQPILFPEYGKLFK